MWGPTEIIVEGFVREVVSYLVASVLPWAAPDGLLTEYLVPVGLYVVLGHYLPALEDRAGEQAPEMGLGTISEYPDSEWVDHFDPFFRRLSHLLGQASGVTGHGFRVDPGPFAAELDVVGRQWFVVVEGQTVLNLEGPT